MTSADDFGPCPHCSTGNLWIYHTGLGQLGKCPKLNGEDLVVASPVVNSGINWLKTIQDLQTEKSQLMSALDESRSEAKDLLDTVEAMLLAAGWDGTLEDLNSKGTKPSHYIKALKEKVDALPQK